MIILSIETSCDDTCIAIIEAKRKKRPCFKILANIVSSQVKIHRKYGGIYPTLAKREHQKNLPIVFKKALKKAGKPKLDAIAVTIGPGLEPCLWVGVNFAKDLAKKLKLPLIPINHIEAHIYANFLSQTKSAPNSQFLISKEVDFPAVCLVVSGGHTQLILMKGYGDFKIIGETRDDAAGECLDKAARILSLGYPGGPAIAKQARQWKLKIGLPRPMIYQKNYDFSFSGLKTAVLYNFKSQSPKVRKSKKYIGQMCFELQQAIIDVLLYKTMKAAKNCSLFRGKKAKTIILGGGVTANEELRRQFEEACSKWNFKCLIPPRSLSTDNAAMVGLAAYYRYLKRKNWQEIKVDANLRIDENL